MTPLETLIRQEIALNGPMELGRYMTLCLGHPVHGYYMTRDPFGAQGDFTTAPEVSQLFGEMIGAWLADTWMTLGAPQKILLVEAGPGRGTLMSDILRATKRVAGFHAAVQIHLLETSPVLREKQRVMLDGYAVHWHDTLQSLPDHAPVLFIANEFLDALPVEHLQFDQDQWWQRAVGVDEKDSLCIGLKQGKPDLLNYCKRLSLNPVAGDILEVSPAGEQFVQQLAFIMKKQTGAGLFIDYGYDQTAFGQTIQALHKHQPVSIFHAPGNSDITAHVNFARVADQLSAAGLFAPALREQGGFLKTLGIETRLDKLLTQATPEQAQDLQSGYEMMTADDQMGRLFKVQGFSHDASIEMAGFLR